jgi:hypothetical protein
MAKKPEPPKPPSWHVCRVANKGKLPGKKAAEKFRTYALRLIAVHRR